MDTAPQERTSFATLLRQYRLAASLSQEELAERAQLSATAIAALERGRSASPRPSTVVLLADALALTSVQRLMFVASAHGGADGQPPDGPAVRPLGAVRHNLPRQLTNFVGREREVAEIRQLLHETPLLTLTGPGGTGKTRVALAAAAEETNVFRDGVLLVDLTPLRQPQLVLSAIARTLGVTEEAGQVLERRVVALLDGRELLLVLDNFEQVISAGSVVARLLTNSPGLRVLVTSREPLQVSGERIFAVPPLAVPDLSRPVPAEALTQMPCVALFVQRAQAGAPEFGVSEDNARTIAALCARLDGLPLAIELAAARARVFPVEEILARLSNRLSFLTGGAREQPARHRTLRAAVEWSDDLLSPLEQVLFRQLGILVGEWSLSTAAAIVDPPGSPSEGGDATHVLLDGIASLVDKNLVRPGVHVAGEVRFGMLETIREYAFDRLAASGDQARLERKRALFLVALSEACEEQFYGRYQQASLDRSESELDNIRAALDWTATEGGDVELGLRLAGALWAFCFIRGHPTEGREWLRKLLRVPASSAISNLVRAKGLFAAGFLASLQADYGVAQSLLADSLTLQRNGGNQAGCAMCFLGLARIHRELGDGAAARSDAEEGLRLARQSGHRGTIGMLTITLADMAFELGDLVVARELYEEGLSLWRELDAQQGIGYALGGLGEVQRANGRAAAARMLYEEGLGIKRALGDRPNTAIALGQLGRVALDLGEVGEARARFTESLIIWRDLDGQRGIALALEGLAAVAAAERRAERAMVLAGAARAVRSATGTRSPPGWQGDMARRLATARQALDRDLCMTAWLRGQSMTLERAIALALAEDEAPLDATTPQVRSVTNQLTSREYDVARLVAQGLTSREMAERLMVTERTVNTHLEHIRDKLGVRSRAEITAWLMRAGLAPDDGTSAQT